MNVKLNKYIGLISVLAVLGCTERQKASQASVLDSTTVALDTTRALPVKVLPDDRSSAGTPPKGADANKWVYKKTGSSGATVRSASITSGAVLDFPPPFNGGSTVTMTLRQREGNTTLALTVSKGQFTSSFQGGSVRIRFDDNPSALYPFSAAGDGATDIIFLDSVPVLLKKLKTARTTVISVGFYGQGTRQIEFRTAGLMWDL